MIDLSTIFHAFFFSHANAKFTKLRFSERSTSIICVYEEKKQNGIMARKQKLERKQIPHVNNSCIAHIIFFLLCLSLSPTNLFIKLLIRKMKMIIRKYKSIQKRLLNYCIYKTFPE